MNNLIPSSLSIFLKGYTVLFACALIGLLLIDKGDLVLRVNELHSEGMDVFFKYWTYLGDGYVLIVLLVLSFFVSKYHSLLLLIIASLQGIVTYVLKKVIFKGTPRPISFFDEQTVSAMNFVEGVKVHGFNSFPSGHTLAAFSFGVFICLMFPKRMVGGIALVIFALVGLSRVYLNQHFLEDITAGSLLGVLVSFGSHWLFSKLLGASSKRKLMEGSVLKKI